MYHVFECTYNNCVLGCETASDKLKLLYLFSVNPDTNMGTHTHDLSLMTTSKSQAKCRIDASFCCNRNVPMETGWAINQQNQTSDASKLQSILHKYLNGCIRSNTFLFITDVTSIDERKWQNKSWKITYECTRGILNGAYWTNRTRLCHETAVQTFIFCLVLL